MTDQDSSRHPNRRAILKGGVAAGAAPLAFHGAAQAQTDNAAPAAQRREVTLNINGQDRTLAIDTRATLLDTLRNRFDLTGSKKGCDHGQCGACTVHVNGERVLSCLTLAATVEGDEIATIEGLADADDALHPMQQAFVDNDAFQCGYCTPGQIMSAIACVREGHAESDADIREYMSGNLCRCAAYPNIVAAVRQAAPQIGRS